MKKETKVKTDSKTDEKKDNEVKQNEEQKISTVEIKEDVELVDEKSIIECLEEDLNNNLEEDGLEEAIVESVNEEIKEAFIEQKLSEDVEDKTYLGDFKDELSTVCKEEDLEESVKEDVEQAVSINAEKVKAEKPTEKLGKDGCIGFFTPTSIDLDNCVGCEYESNCYSRKKAKERIGMSVEINDGKELKVAPEKCFEDDNIEKEGIDGMDAFDDIDEFDDDDEFDGDIDEINKLLAPKLAKIENIVKENQKQIKIGICITGAILGTLALIKLFRKD